MNLDFADPQIYELLVEVCARQKVDPSSSLEAEAFFRNLLSQYRGVSDREVIGVWLDDQIPRHFIALRDRPRWIQGADWQFADGKPMIFVGQIDVLVRNGEVTSRFFHDDTSFYIFIRQNGRPVLVMQQF